jgi:acyl dehydratase
MSTQYFEDIKLNQRYRSREYLLTEKEIIDFATEWDPQAMHVDPNYARNKGFGDVLAAGTHLMAICAKLINERRPRPAFCPSPGWDKVRFVTPARPGDVLVLEIEAIRKRDSKSRPDVGVVIYSHTLLNQREEPVLTREGIALIAKQPKIRTPYLAETGQNEHKGMA